MHDPSTMRGIAITHFCMAQQQSFNLTSTNPLLWNMAHYWVIRRQSSSMWNENTKKNLGQLFENNLRWRLKNNEELCELLDGHGVVKYIQKITVSWSCAWYIMDNSRAPKKYWMENSMEEDLWENRIRRNSFLLLNMRGRRRLVEDRAIWRWPVEDARPLKYKCPVL